MSKFLFRLLSFLTGFIVAIILTFIFYRVFNSTQNFFEPIDAMEKKEEIQRRKSKFYSIENISYDNIFLERETVDSLVYAVDSCINRFDVAGAILKYNETRTFSTKENISKKEKNIMLDCETKDTYSVIKKTHAEGDKTQTKEILYSFNKENAIIQIFNHFGLLVQYNVTKRNSVIKRTYLKHVFKDTSNYTFQENRYKNLTNNYFDSLVFTAGYEDFYYYSYKMCAKGKSNFIYVNSENLNQIKSIFIKSNLDSCFVSLSPKENTIEFQDLMLSLKKRQLFGIQKIDNNIYVWDSPSIAYYYGDKQMLKNDFYIERNIDRSWVKIVKKRREK